MFVLRSGNSPAGVVIAEFGHHGLRSALDQPEPLCKKCSKHYKSEARSPGQEIKDER